MKKNKRLTYLASFLSMTSLGLFSIPLINEKITTKNQNDNLENTTKEIKPGTYLLGSEGIGSGLTRGNSCQGSIKNDAIFDIGQLDGQNGITTIDGFIGISSIEDFNLWIGSNWDIVFNWEEDYWNNNKGLEVQYTVNNDQSSIYYEVGWTNRGDQEWNFTFLVNNFKPFIPNTNNGNQNNGLIDENKLPDWIWYAIGGASGLLLICIIVLIILKTKKRNKRVDANLNKVVTRQTPHPSLEHNNLRQPINNRNPRTQHYQNQNSMNRMNRSSRQIPNSTRTFPPKRR